MTDTRTDLKINLTALAKGKLEEYLSEEPSDTIVRILVEDDGKYGLSLDQADAGDVPFEADGLRFAVEERFASALEGLTIDYLDQGASSGFALTGGRAAAPGKAKKVVLRVEETPNPDARKFVVSFPLGKASKTWTPETREAETPAAIGEVLDLEGVASVFLLADFVTVTRTDGVAWSTLEGPITEALGRLEPPSAGDTGGGTFDSGSLADRLARFVEADVAPFLQQDGGDIELVGISEGTVRVRLVGACGTCPSSIATLQFGVERRLKEAFPDEVKGLELVNPGTF